jgi:putative NADH-flavin reductase
LLASGKTWNRRLALVGGAALLQKSEAITLADMPWLPVRFLSQSEAVGPRVGGYIQNARDFNCSRWLWIK